MNYQSIPFQKILNIDGLISFHYFEYIKNFTGIGESHDFWKFVYVDCGEIWIQSENETLLLHSQEWYLHKPNEYHNIYTLGIFSSVFLFSFQSNSSCLYQLTDKKQLVSHEGKSLLIKLLATGKNALEGPYDDFNQTHILWKKGISAYEEQLLKTLIEQFFLTSFIENVQNHTVLPKSPFQEKREQQLVETIIQILTEHLCENLTLEQIAKKAAFSKSYIEKVFRTQLNITVIDYYHRLKINRAKEFMSNGEMTLTEIGESLGYGTIHNFSRVFKKYMGITPRIYQKTIHSRSLL